MEDTKFNYTSLPKGEDNRKPRATGEFNEYKTDLYDSLINIVLNHKAELQKIPALASLKVASPWAAKRGFTAKEVDLNNDAIKEVVVYNKAGQPIIVNGYKPHANDYAVRRAYYENNSTPESRIGNPMKEWARDYFYEVKVDPNRPWKNIVKKKEPYYVAKSAGYKVGYKPKKEITPFSMFSKLITPFVKAFFDAEGYNVSYYDEEVSVATCAGLLGGNTGPANGQLVRKIISPISFARALFIMIVERFMFYMIMYKDNVKRDRTDIRYTYDYWKQFKKNHKYRVYKFFFDNFIDKATGQFTNKITMIQVASCLHKEVLDFTGKDPEDVLVHLIGPKNLMHDKYRNLFVEEEEAINFLSKLRSDDKSVSRQAKKDLQAMKKISQASTKNWFNTTVKFYFENEDAFQRFIRKIENGEDPNIASQIVEGAPGETINDSALEGPEPKPSEAVPEVEQTEMDAGEIDEDDDEDDE